MMIAVVLSANIRKMIKDNVLVRKPVGLEAAGSMNILFTDKTGTLTNGKMSVRGIILGNGKEYSSYSSMKSSCSSLGEIYRLSCVTNTDTSPGARKTIVGGNSTDKALAASLGDDYFLSDRGKVVKKQAFDSSRKYSSADVRVGKELRRFVKGAPDRLMIHVEKYVDEYGESTFLGSDEKKDLVLRIKSYAAQGERMILICIDDKGDMSSLTMIAAVAVTDKVRNDARKSVEALCMAGIQVVMITGDSKETAECIAKKCGLITSERNLILGGDELSKLSDAEVKKLLPSLAVVSRALPFDKSRLVRIAQEMELVVGMTGDGINDAPALKRADIGFSMGSGTGVAKDAGDIIILDDRLASIVKAVLYGRNIFKSIRKFITLQLTMNFSAVGVSMIGPFIGYEAPVTVAQMLWINIVMDTLGGLAFAGEAASELCMRESPKRRDEPILNGYMINQIFFLGSFTIALCLGILLLPEISGHFRYMKDDVVLLTAFFTLFIFTSVFNCFNARSDRIRLFSGLTGNPMFMLIMSAVCVIQLVFTYLGGAVLRTVPLTVGELGYTMLLSMLVFPFDILRKLLWRLRGKKEGF